MGTFPEVEFIHCGYSKLILLHHQPAVKRFGVAKTIHSCSRHSCMNLDQLLGNSDDDQTMCLVLL